MTERPGTSPPPFQLEDPGVVWRAVPAGIRIERRLTFLAVLRSTLWLAGIWAMVWMATRSAPLWLALFIWFGGLFLSIYWLLMLHFRADMMLSKDRATWWFQGTPRRFEGGWQKRVTGVRFVRGPPVSWGSRRYVAVQVEADGSWTDLITGNGERRGRRLAQAIASALGLIVEEIQETFEPDVEGAVARWRERRRMGEGESGPPRDA